jgi:hypothetical protein
VLFFAVIAVIVYRLKVNVGVLKNLVFFIFKNNYFLLVKLLQEATVINCL